MKIKDSYIEEMVDKCKCPTPMFCTVANIIYEPPKRERLCLVCWLQFCKDNNIEIDYEEK